MNRIDPIILLLSALFIFCATLALVVGIWSPDDSVIFTWAAGLSTGFLGMIALRIKPSRGEPGDETTTTTLTKSEPPKEQG